MTSSREITVPAMQRTQCAICDRSDCVTELWPATFNPEAFSSPVFSARRLPDGVHYRMVTCNRCGHIRSDPVASEELLATLYAASSFDYGDEVGSIQATYARALNALEARSPKHDGLLEIGCGNGFFLMQARQQGWKDVRGVEPSADAVGQALPELAGTITKDVMRAGLFAPKSFDAVCLFQVLDHISTPVDLLEECFAVLRPGGHILALNHNAAAWSARLLGERSPIVDIEHTYLYTPATMRSIFAKVGFVDSQVRGVRNTYSLPYLAHLIPLPTKIKLPLLRALLKSPARHVRATVPLGNLCLIARKPD